MLITVVVDSELIPGTIHGNMHIHLRTQGQFVIVSPPTGMFLEHGAQSYILYNQLRKSITQ